MSAGIFSEEWEDNSEKNSQSCSWALNFLSAVFLGGRGGYASAAHPLDQPLLNMQSFESGNLTSQ